MITMKELMDIYEETTGEYPVDIAYIEEAEES